MCPVYLMTPGTRAKLKSESLVIESSEDGRIVETYPIEEIDHLVLHSGVHIGTQAISKILKNGSPIIFASGKRVVRGIATASKGRFFCSAKILLLKSRLLFEIHRVAVSKEIHADRHWERFLFVSV